MWAPETPFVSRVKPLLSGAGQVSYLPPKRIPTNILRRVRYFISQLRMILRGAILQRGSIIWMNHADTNSWWNLQTLRLDHLDRAALA